MGKEIAFQWDDQYIYETMGAVNTQIEVDAKARLNFVVGPFVL
jgi:hypothetical protein